MGYCIFCEEKEREHWGGSWCAGCRQLKNLCNVYGYERILDILKECCVRNPNQLEAKIRGKKIELSKETDVIDNPKIVDEKTEYYLRRKADKTIKKQ
jgi:hypothetical protein